VDPLDRVTNAVDGGVVLRAGERGGVALDGDDARPALREGEGNDVAARAGEEVDQDGGGGGGGGAGRGQLRERGPDVSGDSAARGGSLLVWGQGAKTKTKTYEATGSGVTPNQASLVSFMS
jgi:hypothetical protein